MRLIPEIVALQLAQHVAYLFAGEDLYFFAFHLRWFDDRRNIASDNFDAAGPGECVMQNTVSVAHGPGRQWLPVLSALGEKRPMPLLDLNRAELL
jgi:hypothetical protein